MNPGEAAGLLALALLAAAVLIVLFAWIDNDNDSL